MLLEVDRCRGVRDLERGALTNEGFTQSGTLSVA
jgi:hypothetical protein